MSKKTKLAYDKYSEVYTEQNSNSFYHKYIEKPAMYKLLPDLKGKKVLCIGVGTGEEADYMQKLGASVLGTDISDGMIQKAKEQFPSLDLRVISMEDLEFEDNTFDLVYSSLAIHYTFQLPEIFAKIYRFLKPDGVFQFSTMHPIDDIKEELVLNEWKYKVIGYGKNKETNEETIFGTYFDEDKRTMKWSEDVSFEYSHYTLQTYINELICAGFTLESYTEPKPIPESEQVSPKHFRRFSQLPLFSIFVAKKASKHTR